MFFASNQRFQIVDLGSHSLKGVVASIGRDGRLTIEGAKTVTVTPAGPGFEAYLAALPAALSGLASVFRRGQLVHFVPPAAQVRGAVHRLPPVSEDAVPEILRTSRAAFIGSFGAKHPMYDRSFPLQVAREEGLVRVTAVHAFARRHEIAQVREALEGAGLKPGAVIAPLLAQSEVAAALANLGDDAPRVMVELGAGLTSVFMLDDAAALSYYRVFGGAEDGFRRLTEEVPDLDAAGVAKLRDAFAAKGRGGLEAAAAELGLDEGLAQSIGERAAAVGDRLLTATFHAIAHLSPSAHDEDGETTTAVQMPGGIVFTGGGAELPGLCESASSRFEVGCQIGDPCALLGASASAKLGVGPAFTTALGALSVLARIGADAANLAEEAIVQPQAAGEDVPAAAWAFRPLVAGAVMSLVAVVGFVGAGNMLEDQARELEKSLEADRTAMPPPQEVQKLLLAFRDLRAKEVVADARFAYIAELFRNRSSWPKVLAELDRGMAGTKCIVENVDVQVAWPNSADAGRGTRARQRWVWATLKGQAPVMAAVTGAVQSLRSANVMKDPKPKTSTGNRGSAFDQKAPSIQFEISGDLENAVER